MASRHHLNLLCIYMLEGMAKQTRTAGDGKKSLCKNVSVQKVQGLKSSEELYHMPKTVPGARTRIQDFERVEKSLHLNMKQQRDVSSNRSHHRETCCAICERLLQLTQQGDSLWQTFLLNPTKIYVTTI